MDAKVDLRLFRKRNSLTQDVVAAYLGTTKGFISQVENGRVGLSDDKLKRLLNNDMGWDTDGLVKESIVDHEPNTVPMPPIFAQAGSLSGWSEGIEEVKCERVISPVKDIDMAVRIYGESMYPDISNGSVCYVRRVTGHSIDWGRAYILDTVDGPVIKYLAPGSDDEHVKCISANHDPRFADYEILKADILGLYRVVVCMKMM